ncbi:unnamed protein product [Brassicogethes aeneus]|uniref:DNA/RNA-binding protein Alba-like domain-containing protein n=1 Tax=Brassicogethes aeneus TaxID=1431903 RepID=A0A9P0B4V5_BRAAE|nr:unnamed protein product [Brassicogethes aeneus]
MENYKKGKNVEEPLNRNNIPIPNLPNNFLWMQVRGGSKIRNLLTHALNEFPETKNVVWTGFGPSVGKAVTCAELTKREYNNRLHQITKLSHRQVDEYWDPLLPELDKLVVKRKLPMIHIYLSIDPINSKELGYQAPGVFLPYKSHDPKAKKKFNNNRSKTNKKTNNKNLRKNENSGQSTSKDNTDVKMEL